MGRGCFRQCLQVCLWTALSGVTFAAGTSAPDRIVLPNDGAYVVQVLGYVVAILILLGAGLVVLFKRGYVGGLSAGGKSLRKLQIEETRMLGHRQYLLVAEYEGRRMMLGVCPGRIDYLCPLDSDLEGDAVPGVSFPTVNPEGSK